MRLQDCLLGLAVGEALALKPSGQGTVVRGLNAQLAILVDCSLCGAWTGCEAQSPESVAKAFAKGLVGWLQDAPPDNPSAACAEVASRIASNRPWAESGLEGAVDNSCVARGAPIGAWASSVGAAAEFAIEVARITHPEELAVSSAAAAAVICFLAADGVPSGQWAARAVEIVSVNGELVRALSLTSRLAADRVDPMEAFGFLGDGEAAPDAVARALFCCMSSPGSFAGPVAVAAGAPGDAAATAALVGAWMAARNGIAGIPEGWKGRVTPDIMKQLEPIKESKAEVPAIESPVPEGSPSLVVRTKELQDQGSQSPSTGQGA